MPTNRKSSYGDSKNTLLKRLNRAEGQLRGISRMIAEDAYCIDVLTQISAAQAALDRTALELLRGHAKDCLSTNDGSRTTADAPSHISDDQSDAQADAQAEEFITAVKRLITR